MSQKISLKAVEKEAFRSTFDDGLLDIFLGSVFMMFAIAPLLSPYLGDFWSSAIFVPYWAIVFVTLWLIRKYLVKPRIGVVKFGAWRKTRLMRYNVLMVIVFTASLSLAFLSFYRFDAVPGWVHTARFSLVVLVAFSAAAYFLGIRRLFLYGILLALAPLVGELLYEYFGFPHHGYPVTFGAVSALMILTGIILLVRLVRSHPIDPLPSTIGEMIE